MKLEKISWNRFWNGLERAQEWLKREKFKPELVIGLEKGGTVPGAAFAAVLEVPFETLKVSFYEDGKKPARKYCAPKISGGEKAAFAANGKKVLLADDVVRSGATLEKAREFLEEAGARQVISIVAAGKKTGRRAL